jgi:hypothetical protein
MHKTPLAIPGKHRIAAPHFQILSPNTAGKWGFGTIIATAAQIAAFAHFQNFPTGCEMNLVTLR